MAEPVIRARCQPQLLALVDQAAQRRGTKPSEYIRRSVTESLERDGFRIEPQQYALVEGGSLVLKTDRAGGPPVPVIVTKIDGDTRTWLPVENEDTQAFDAKLHWRLAPHYRVEDSRVVRVYPVVLKSMENA